MNDQDRDLTTLLEDVRTIKSILTTADAPLPPVWRLLYFVAFPGLVLIAALKFLVPVLAPLSFLDTVLVLWLPVLSVVGLIIALRVRQYLKKTGTRFLAQGRVQVFLYTRLVLAPSIFTIGYLLSLNPAYSMDGAMAVLCAVGLTQVVVLMPREFRLLPFVFLLGGLIELALGLRGAVWTLVNTLAMALSFFWIGALLQRQEDHTAPAPEADRV